MGFLPWVWEEEMVAGERGEDQSKKEREEKIRLRDHCPPECLFSCKCTEMNVGTLAYKAATLILSFSHQERQLLIPCRQKED